MCPYLYIQISLLPYRNNSNRFVALTENSTLLLDTKSNNISRTRRDIEINGCLNCRAYHIDASCFETMDCPKNKQIFCCFCTNTTEICSILGTRYIDEGRLSYYLYDGVDTFEFSTLSGSNTSSISVQRHAISAKETANGPSQTASYESRIIEKAATAFRFGSLCVDFVAAVSDNMLLIFDYERSTQNVLSNLLQSQNPVDVVAEYYEGNFYVAVLYSDNFYILKYYQGTVYFIDGVNFGIKLVNRPAGCFWQKDKFYIWYTTRNSVEITEIAITWYH